jgi:hypothetical protein
MTINDVLAYVQKILQRVDDFVPALYVSGTRDKQVVLMNGLSEKPYEKELVFEFNGMLVASNYDLGELTQVYFVRRITGYAEDDQKKLIEFLSINCLDLLTNTQKVLVYEIVKKNGAVTLDSVEFEELRDPFTSPSLLLAFVKGYRKH